MIIKWNSCFLHDFSFIFYKIEIVGYFGLLPEYPVNGRTAPPTNTLSIVYFRCNKLVPRWIRHPARVSQPDNIALCGRICPGSSDMECPDTPMFCIKKLWNTLFLFKNHTQSVAFYNDRE